MTDFRPREDSSRPLRPRGPGSRVQPVSQLEVTLHRKDDHSLKKVVTSILGWIEPRTGSSLPKEAWRLQPFELTDIGSQRTAAVTLDTPRCWAARLDDADKKVARRTWSTEIYVLDNDHELRLGVRLVCTSHDDGPAYDRSVPGFVSQLLRQYSGRLDGYPISQTAQLIRTHEEVEALATLLQDPYRTADVILVSLPEESESLSDSQIDHSNLHRRLQGIAHVYFISGPAGFFLTDRIGRSLSTFHQGVRSYRPGLVLGEDDPGRHPLTLARRIQEWTGGPQAFTTWLINQALRQTVIRPSAQKLPSFTRLRQLATKHSFQQARQQGSDDTAMLALYEADNEQLRKEVQEYELLLQTADQERSLLEEELRNAHAQTLGLRHRIRQLELAQRELPQSDVVIPNSLEGFEQWCHENLSGAVELVRRAYDGVQQSQFHDPALIYRALLLLRHYYVPMRQEGGSERHAAYLQALAELYLDDEPIGEAGNYYSGYEVNFRGRRRELERHLKGSNSRDPRHGFRLYYFWDDEEQLVVVGWLPSHLTNRAS